LPYIFNDIQTLYFIIGCIDESLNRQPKLSASDQYYIYFVDCDSFLEEIGIGILYLIR